MSRIYYSLSSQWAQRHVALSTGKWNPFSGSGQAGTHSRHSEQSNVLRCATPHELQSSDGKSATKNISCYWHHFKSTKTCYLSEHRVKTCFKIAWCPAILQKLTPFWTLCGSQQKLGDVLIQLKELYELKSLDAFKISSLVL